MQALDKICSVTKLVWPFFFFRGQNTKLHQIPNSKFQLKQQLSRKQNQNICSVHPTQEPKLKLPWMCIRVVGSRGLSPLLRYKGIPSLNGKVVFGGPFSCITEVGMSHSPDVHCLIGPAVGAWTCSTRLDWNPRSPFRESKRRSSFCLSPWTVSPCLRLSRGSSKKLRAAKP